MEIERNKVHKKKIVETSRTLVETGKFRNTLGLEVQRPFRR